MPGYSLRLDEFLVTSAFPAFNLPRVVYSSKSPRPNTLRTLVLHGYGKPDKFNSPSEDYLTRNICKALAEAGLLNQSSDVQIPSLSSGEFDLLYPNEYYHYPKDYLTAIDLLFHGDYPNYYSQLGEKVNMVGVGLGAAVALAYAQAYPNKVQSVAGIAPVVDLNYAYDKYDDIILQAWNVQTKRELPGGAQIQYLRNKAKMSSIPVMFAYDTSDVNVFEEPITNFVVQLESSVLYNYTGLATTEDAKFALAFKQVKEFLYKQNALYFS